MYVHATHYPFLGRLGYYTLTITCDMRSWSQNVESPRTSTDEEWRCIIMAPPNPTRYEPTNKKSRKRLCSTPSTMPLQVIQWWSIDIWWCMEGLRAPLDLAQCMDFTIKYRRFVISGGPPTTTRSRSMRGNYYKIFGMWWSTEDLRGPLDLAKCVDFTIKY